MKVNKSKNILPVSLMKSFAELSSNGLLVRAQTKTLWDKVLAGESFLLDGPKGIGKSSTLLQLVCAAASSKELLVLYAPSMGRWTAGYYPYYSSNNEPGKYEQPELAQDIISMFEYLNGDKLEARPELKNVLNDQNSSPIQKLSQLLSTLKAERTVFALDQVNALYCDTQYRSPEGVFLKVDDFIVLKEIKTLAEFPNITIISSHSTSDPLINHPVYADTIMTKNRIQLRPFDLEEVQCLLDYYNQLGHSYKSSSKYSQLIQFVSGGKPETIMKACNYETIYSS